MARVGNGKKDLTVSLKIARTSSGSTSGWAISIEDEASHLLVGELRLTNEQLGEALGGVARQIKMESWGASDRLGKTAEVARIYTDLDSDDFRFQDTPEDEKESLASIRKRVIFKAMREQGHPPEDGWEPEVPRSFNHHRRSDKGYEVTILRYVDPLMTETAS